MTLKELIERRAKCIADARAVFDRAQSEGRAMTAEESQAYDRAMDESDRHKASIEALQTAEKRAARLAEAEADAARVLPRKTGDAPVGVNESSETEYRYTLRWPSRHERVLRLSGSTATKEYREAFSRFVRHGGESECRAISVDVAASGGYLVMPQQMAAGITRAVDDEVFVRRLATVVQVQQADSLGIRTQETNPDDADWTAEVREVSVDSGQTFGKRELKPSLLSKAVDVSQRMLRVMPEIESFIQDRLAYKFSITMEKAYMTGHGANQPLGVFTASANGVPTTRDVTCGTTTAITDTGLIDMLYALKPGYRSDASCAWVFSRAAMAQIRKLKDSQGGYLWKPGQGLETNTGDTLLGYPVFESEYVPATFTTGQYVGMIAAWRHYWIADSLTMTIQRLNELKAAMNLVEFIGRAETDGMPVIAEAFVRGKLA